VKGGDNEDDGAGDGEKNITVGKYKIKELKKK
jgi:hypothetical protein